MIFPFRNIIAEALSEVVQYAKNQVPKRLKNYDTQNLSLRIDLESGLSVVL